MKTYHLILGPIGTNSFLVSDDNGVAVAIDPATDCKHIIQAIKEHNLSLKAILLTHAHYDHIGAVAPLVAEYPELDVYMHAEDNDLAMYYKAGNLPAYIKKEDYSEISINKFIKDNDVISVGDLKFDVIHTPGHTKGGVCYRCEDTLFTGDTLFKNSVGRTDLEGGHYPTLLKSLAKLANLEGDYNVLPGHEGFSTLSSERKVNHYIREALK